MTARTLPRYKYKCSRIFKQIARCVITWIRIIGGENLTGSLKDRRHLYRWIGTPDVGKRIHEKTWNSTRSSSAKFLRCLLAGHLCYVGFRRQITADHTFQGIMVQWGKESSDPWGCTDIFKCHSLVEEASEYPLKHSQKASKSDWACERARGGGWCTSRETTMQIRHREEICCMWGENIPLAASTVLTNVPVPVFNRPRHLQQ